MSAGRLASILLILLLICLKFSHSGVKKIKIHVPYYVKHVHHYKKIYVPKVHVIKHEHHHKKEYDHHHHHHEVHKRGPYRSYEKSSHEYPDEFSHDVYYDDIESKSYRGRGKKRAKPWKLTSSIEHFQRWKNAEGADYVENVGDDDDEFATYPKQLFIRRRSDDDVKNEEDENVGEENENEEHEGEAAGEEEEEEEEEGKDEEEDKEEDEDEDDNENEYSENQTEYPVKGSTPLPSLRKDNSEIFITTTKRPLR